MFPINLGSSIMLWESVRSMNPST